MTDRPILFSGEMVRAILDGKKTQTRRLVTLATSDAGRATWARANLSRAWADPGMGSGGYLHAPLLDVLGDPADDRGERVHCRIGVGDRLWVRETFASYYDVAERTQDGWRSTVVYRATATPSEVSRVMGWRPSIFMRRAESRLTLDVTAVRVERLQDITEADARAEGVDPDAHVFPSSDCPPATARECFRWLWESINGKRAPWASNPWVWVVEFRREETGR